MILFCTCIYNYIYLILTVHILQFQVQFYTYNDYNHWKDSIRSQHVAGCQFCYEFKNLKEIRIITIIIITMINIILIV